MAHGIDAEFTGAELKDERLSKRLVALATRMTEEPASSFPASLNEAELEGAYRFFSNEKVNAQEVLKPHVARTVARSETESVSLALHDTTTLSFRNEGKRTGFGSLTGESQQLWTHATLAVSSDGLRTPHGVLALTTTATIDHERWYEHVSKANALVADPTRLVHVMDREGDDYALFAKLVASNARFVIRSRFDRSIERAGIHAPASLTAALARTKHIAEREVVVGARGTNSGSKARRVHPARNRRVARLSMSAASVEIQRPRSRGRRPPLQLAVNVVRVWEAAPPAGEPAVEWLLLTTESVASVEDMLRVVDWYRARWVIEEFFKALKTGCAIEKRQLESFRSLGNAVALFGPIAWQLLLLRHRARHAPQSNGRDSLPAGMLMVLPHIARKPLADPPTARDIFLAVAALGGHLKRNGEPGWQTLARGFEKLRSATAVWELARQTLGCDQS